VSSLRCAYNPTSTEARIYLEINQISMSTLERHFELAGAKSITMDNFSVDDWETSSAAALKSVLDKAASDGYILIEFGDMPKASAHMPKEAGGAEGGPDFQRTSGTKRGQEGVSSSCGNNPSPKISKTGEYGTGSQHELDMILARSMVEAHSRIATVSDKMIAASEKNSELELSLMTYKHKEEQAGYLKQIRRLTKKVSVLEGAAAEECIKVKLLQQEVDSEREKVETLINKANESNALYLETKNKLERDSKAWDDDRLAFLGALAAEAKLRSAAESKLAEETQRRVDAETKLADANAMKDALRQEVALLANEVTDENTKNEALQQQVFEMEKQMDESLETAEKLGKKLAQTQSELKTKIVRLSDELSARRASAADQSLTSALNRPRKLKSKDSHFYRIKSPKWNNDHDGVNYFIDLPDDEEEDTEQLVEAPSPADNIIVGVATRIDDGPGVPPKFHGLAFVYKGRRITKQSLRDSFMVKEAYGVEANGAHYVCLILYQGHGRTIDTIASVPYAYGILPNNIVPELVGGDAVMQRHISAFKLHSSVEDPVLTMLKTPSVNKWKWYNIKFHW